MLINGHLYKQEKLHPTRSTSNAQPAETKINATSA